MEHFIDRSLLTGRVRVHLVGVGGNGAQMANCLARLDIAMRALGHPAGIHVTAFDPDKVSEANVGRQIFGPADIGQYKSVLTIHRLNAFHGLDWDAMPVTYDERNRRESRSDVHMVVSCVDSAHARRGLHDTLFKSWTGARYWLDLGNTQDSAQVVLGQPLGARRLSQKDEWIRLPCVTELFPQLLDASRVEDNTPSCSVAISLAGQGLFVNDMAVRWGAHILYELFSEGCIRQHGVVVNLKSKRAGPIDIDHTAWRRFGLRRRKPAEHKIRREARSASFAE